MPTSRTDDPYDVANSEVSGKIKRASAIFLLILKTSLQDEYPTSWYLHLYCDRGQGPENTEFLPFFGEKKNLNQIEGGKQDWPESCA